MSRLLTIPTGNLIQLPAVLFTEDFETPVVVGYDQGTIPSRWLGSNVGFGSDRRGLDNKSSGNWEDGTSSQQAITFQYTNTGLCTSASEIATIDINTVTYRLTAQVAYDKAVSGPHGNPSGDYEVRLCAMDAGDSRTDWAAGYAATFVPRTIINLSGTVANDDGFHEFTGTYTTDPVTDAAKAGFDLAVALRGATDKASVVKVKVEIE
jgi:hypothetical protein